MFVRLSVRASAHVARLCVCLFACGGFRRSVCVLVCLLVSVVWLVGWLFPGLRVSCLVGRCLLSCHLFFVLLPPPPVSFCRCALLPVGVFVRLFACRCVCRFVFFFVGLPVGGLRVCYSGCLVVWLGLFGYLCVCSVVFWLICFAFRPFAPFVHVFSWLFAIVCLSGSGV